MLRFRFIVIFFLFILFFSHAARAQPLEAELPNLAEASQEPGLESIHSKLAELKADTSLEDSTRTRLTDLYESALKQLKAVEDYKRQTDFFRESALQAPKEFDNINKQLDLSIEASKKNASVDYQKFPPDQLDNQLFKTRLRLESLKNNLEQLGRNLKQEQSRPEQIRLDQRSIQDRLQELEDQQRSRAASINGKYKAQFTALRATEKALQANLNSLQMEMSSHPPRLQLLRARYDLAIAKVATESARLENLEKFVAEHRESEAARYSKELAEALQAASNKHPLIREMIQQNFKLDKEFRVLSEDIGVATQRLGEIKEEAKRIEAESENSEKKISLAGLSPTLAAILREQRRLLPSQVKIDRRVEKLVSKTGEVTLRQFEIEENLQSFLDIDTKVQKRLASSSQDDELSKHQFMRVRVELNLLLEDQKSLLLKLSEANSKYLNLLGELDYSKQRVSELAHKYAAFLDQNLLWVKSSPPINEKFFWNLAKAVHWFISPQRWWETGTSLLAAFESTKLPALLLSALVLAILSGRPKIQARLTEISELVGVVRTDRFRYTLNALAFTILRVSPWVVALYGFGWLLHSNINNPEFTRAVGRGFCAASLPLFSLQTFYRIFAPNGIAELHLKWRRNTVSALESQVRWLRFVVIPCVFFISSTANQSETEYSDSLGRLALIVLLFAISIGLGKILHPIRGALKYVLAEHYTSLIFRTRFFWYSIIVIIPLVIAGFASAGFLASAIELQEKLIATIRVGFIALFIHQLAIRGLRLYNRELALKKLIERRQVEKTAKPAGEAGETISAVDPAEIDISTINTQTTRVLMAVTVFGTLIMYWLLWQDVFPALAILNEWVFWHKTVTVDGVESIKPVALYNLLVAILYILAALTAIRNLPGLMEVLIMNRFSIDSGSRYAINQLIGYALIAATVVLVATELGGQWSQLQWMVAALGVGLGFGLQEIFANFISGIILLFERPIRIGDTVTVGEVSGTVTRIQIRATTITDWERRDLVVPNKTFITDKLINWTRTDNITRILIPIGIAYGSDTVLAHRIITEIVHSHPLVLKEPESTVFFVGFGESSLNFEIRLFVKEIGNRLPLTHDLHMQLNRELNKHGIEIPFPRRDIHLRLNDLTSISKQPPAPASDGRNQPEG